MNGLAIDHLVVGARTLAEGVDWCEETLGVVPPGGGRHPLMGTHNRVMAIASPVAPRAYLEVIAIDPEAPDPGRRRWFDLDSPAMHAALAQGPRLIHWVARCDAIDAQCARWREAGIERGEVLDAQRQTDQGLLRWRISVRRDGVRLFEGALPTLIEWGDMHPADGMVESGVKLQHLEVGGLPVPAQDLCHAPGVRFADGGPAIAAVLCTPKGEVRLSTS